LASGKDAVKWVATGTTIDPAERAELAERGAQVARSLLRGAERLDSDVQHPYLERKKAFPLDQGRRPAHSDAQHGWRNPKRPVDLALGRIALHDRR